MNVSLTERTLTRVVLAATGLLQGLIYYLAFEFWPDGVDTRAVCTAIVFFVSAFALIFQLGWTGRDIKRQVAITAVAPLVLAAVAYWVFQQIPVDDVPYRFDDMRAPTWTTGSAIILLLVTPFIQIFVRTGQRYYPYAEIFNGIWRNLLIVTICGAIVGAFWAVILLWSELFKLIEITLFEEVFTHAAFVCMSLATVFGYAVALAREWDKLTTTIRTVLLTVLKALMPLLAVIALLFLVSLPFTGLQPLWDTRHASATLLALIGTTILFFNGAFDDGTGAPPYSPWVRHLVEAALVTIPAYAVIALYALYLRIDQYGLTFGRFYGVTIAICGLLFGLGYAVEVFRRRGGWMDGVRQANMRMIWLVVVCAILTHTPLLDPLRWSARNQLHRLSSASVDARDFDFGYLRFQLGHIGWETLERIEQLTDHLQADIIAERVALTRAAESYADVRPKPVSLLAASDISPLDTATMLPDSLVRLVVANLTQSQADECEANRDCSMFAVNLDDDTEQEFVLLLSGERRYSMLVFDRDESGKWTEAGRLLPIERGARIPSRATLVEQLLRDGAKAEEARYKDLVIGDIRLRVMR